MSSGFANWWLHYRDLPLFLSHYCDSRWLFKTNFKICLHAWFLGLHIDHALQVGVYYCWWFRKSKSHIPPFFRGSSLVATWKSHAMHHFWLSPGPALNSTGSKTVVKALLGKAIMWEIRIYRNIYEVFLPFYPYNPTQKLYYLKYFERLTGPFSRVQSPPRQESFGL